MNVHLYPSPFVSESRMIREIEAIISLGLSPQVVVLGVMSPGLSLQQLFGDKFKVVRFNLHGAKLIGGMAGKVFDLLEYMVNSYLYCFREKPNVINCHSLNVLSVGIIYKFINKKTRIIYDAHELETERAGLSGVAQKVSKWVERILIRYVDHVIVVCDPIRDWYQETYGVKNISVVRNIPKNQSINPRNEILRLKHVIPNDHIVFIYQGILSKARGVYEMLVAFKSVQPNRHIVFMGYGPAQDDIVSAAKEYPNIHFQPAVSPEEIIAHTSGADVGLNFISGDLCLSYQLSLPNKYFEYIYAGCCVLVSDNLTYLSNLIELNGLGWSIRPDAESLASKVMAISVEDVWSSRQKLGFYVESNYWELDQMNYKEAFGHV
jgi:glycosyltransferase involved in cell wall biosynthesis